MKPDISGESRFLPTLPVLGGGFPSEYRHNVWYRKTRMVWVPGSENFLTIYLFVSSEYTNVTDRWTDRQTLHNGISRAYAWHRAAKTD